MIRIKTALFSLVVAVAASSAALTLAEAQQKPAGKPAEAAKETPKEAAREAPKQSPQAVNPPPVAISPIAQAMASVGAVECMGQINQLSNALTANAKSGAYLFVHPSEGARRLASVSFEVNAQNTVAYSSASFAPVIGGGCQALYEAVMYWEKPCGEVAKAAFSAFQPAKALLKDIAVLVDPETPARLFLMPAGKGCVSIKKNVLF